MGKKKSHTTPTLFELEERLGITDAITISGSRDFSTRHSVIDGLFESALSSFVGKKRSWLIGGAIGIDQLATEWLLSREENVVAVVPFAIADQPREVQSTLVKVSHVVELHHKKTKRAFLDRNLYMLEHSDTAVAFWNGQRGGTWNAVQQALKLHLQLHVYPI